MDWTYHMPVHVFGGRGCVAEKGQVLNTLGTKALLVTGKNSARLCGALQDMTTLLASLGITAVNFDEVEPNPSIETVRRAAALARETDADFIIGIGGGSPLDAAKAVALLARNDLDDDALFGGRWPHAPLPVVAVPTTSGTGSEVTQYAILTDDRKASKRNLAAPVLFPRLAFCDPAYTDALPDVVSIHTAIDAMSHAVEGYVSARATVMTDVLAREAMSLLGEALRVLAETSGLEGLAGATGTEAFDGTPVAQDMRDQLMRGSTLGGMVIAHTGTTALHAMGYSLTYFRHIDHGRANGLLMAPWLAYVAQTAPERVFGALDAMGFASLADLSVTLDALLGEKEQLTKEEIARFSGIAATAGNLPNSLRIPTQADLAVLYATLSTS